MEYDDSSPQIIEGAFYATTSYQESIFNYFREEEQFDLNTILLNIDDATETAVLKNNNLLSIKNSPEFIINKNRIHLLIEFLLLYFNMSVWLLYLSMHLPMWKR